MGSSLLAVADPARRAALHATGLLDSPAEASFDRITRLAARLLRAPAAAVSLIDVERHFLKSCVGIADPWARDREIPYQYSYCRYVVAERRTLAIEDARTHPLVRDLGTVREMGVVAYLGVPLVTRDGQALGSVSVIDTVPRRWTAEDQAMLADLAASVVTEIELRGELAVRAHMQQELMTAMEDAGRARARADEASRTKSEFLSRMSHELRTPLNSIIGFANILSANRSGVLHEPELTYAQRIRDNGMHLLGLIDDILDLSRVEAGKLAVDRSVVALDALVREVVAHLGGAVAGRDVVLRAELPPRLGALTTDPARLKQVLINLVGNACKFTPEGTVAVEVEASAGGEPLAIVVRDTGIGIPPERLGAIFEAFEQGERTTARRFGGTGLGLAVSRSLCELLGYALTVESTVGRGSVFRVDLAPPRRAAARADVRILRGSSAGPA